MKRTALTLLLAATACVPEEGPMMAPFQDCIGCHNGGAATRWTVAGTWAKGAHVTITDSNGKTVALRGNDVGNFYTAEGLAFPITVSVDGAVMHQWDRVTGEPDPTKVAQVSYGGCNACHFAPGQTIELGENMLPGSDCLGCHAPGGMAATRPESTFYAAGTFPPPEWPQGTPVRVAGQTATTTQAGNFYISHTSATAPISFATPQPAFVDTSEMEDGAPHGSCNVCHVNGKADDD
jgi:hypothetical protein